MEQKERWDRFVNSGKVEDYLAYCMSGGIQTGQESGGDTEKVEEYERNGDSDRNGSAVISYERVR